MIIYKDIEQGTEDWFALKWRKIGGTLSKGLFVDSDNLFIDLLSQFLEDFDYEENSFSSYSMERGNDLEPFAREFLNKYTGLDFETVGWLQSEENELLGISPDGITDDLKHQCEIKCFGRKKHTEVLLNNEVPKEHLNQCLHAFAINDKLESVFFIAFRPESDVNNFIKEIKRDSLVDVGLTTVKEIEVIGAKGKPIKPKIVKEKKLVNVEEVSKIIKDKSNMMLDRINKKILELKF